MSGKLMGECFALKLSRVERDLLQAVCDHSDDAGKRAHPGVRLLSWKCDLSERQVQRVLGRLIAKGLLTPVAYQKGGRGRATEFLVDLSRAERKPPYQSRSVKGDADLSPFTEIKGDISDPERVTDEAVKGDISTQNGDKSASPQPPEEPSRRTANTTPGGGRAPSQASDSPSALDGSPEASPDPPTKRPVGYQPSPEERRVRQELRVGKRLRDGA